MELFNIEFGQCTALKGLWQIPFPWQNNPWIEGENEGFFSWTKQELLCSLCYTQSLTIQGNSLRWENPWVAC